MNVTIKGKKLTQSLMSGDDLYFKTCITFGKKTIPDRMVCVKFFCSNFAMIKFGVSQIPPPSSLTTSTTVHIQLADDKIKKNILLTISLSRWRWWRFWGWRSFYDGWIFGFNWTELYCWKFFTFWMQERKKKFRRFSSSYAINIDFL